MADQQRRSLACPPELAAHDPWLHAFAVAVVIATFLLLVAGGNVTSRAAGMAVPDWPLSFKSVNPAGWTSDFNGEKPGVRDEHGHRLIGAAVGVLVTALTVWLAARDPRRWVKLLGVAAFVGVALQGVMGGLRVLGNSVTLALVHGCFAQAFLCLVVAIATVTSRRWLADGTSDAAGPAPTASDHTALRWATGAGLGIIYAQVVLGAILRHTQTTWIPHLAWAMVVGLALMTITRYVFQHPTGRRRLAGATIALLVLYCLQVILGLGTLMAIYPMWSHGSRTPTTSAQIMLPTIHLAFGAAILGLTANVAVRAHRIAGRAGTPLPADAEGAMA